MGYELVHDKIAKQIFAKASTEAQTRRKIEKQVRERYEANLERGARLTQDDLDYFTPYLKQVNLTAAEEHFLQKERRALQGRRRLIRGLIALIFLVLAALTAYAFWQQGQAEIAKEEAVLQKNTADQNLQKAVIAEQNALLQKDIAVEKSDSLDLISAALKISFDSLERKEEELQGSLSSLDRSNRALDASLDSIQRQKEAIQQALISVRAARDSTELARAAAVANAEAAQKARDEALQRTREAQSNALAAKAREVYPNDHTLALNLAYSAYQTHPGSEALNILGEILRNNQNSYYQRAFNHGAAITDTDLSRDGRQLLSGGINGQAILWNRETGDKVLLDQHRKPITALTFSHDGRYILTSSEDSTAILWNTQGEALVTLRLPYYRSLEVFHEGNNQRLNGRICTVAMSPSGEHILLGTRNGHIYQYQRTSGSASGPPAYTCQSRYPDSYLYLLETDRARNGRVSMRTLKQARMIVRFLSDDRFVAVSGKGFATIWDVKGEKIRDIELMPKQEGGIAEQVSLMVGADGRTLYMANDITGAQTVDPDRGKVKQLLDQPVNALVSVPTLGYLSAFTGGAATLWSADGKRLRDLAGMGTVVDMLASPDGRYLYTAGPDGLIKEWDLQGKQGKDNYLIASLPGSSSYAFLGNNSGLLVGNQVYDLRGRPLRNLSFLTNAERVVTSPAHPNLLLSITGKEAVIWTLDGNRRNTFTHRQTITAAAFHPSQPIVVTASRDSTAKIWHLDEAAPRYVINAHRNGISAVAFSPGGDTLATAGRDSTLRLWKLDGKLLLKNLGIGEAVSSVDFSRDGQLIFVGCHFPWMIAPGRNAGNGLSFFRPESTVPFDPIATMLIFDLKRGEIVKRIRSELPTELVRRSPDGQSVLYLMGDDLRTPERHYGIPYLRDVESWAALMTFQLEQENSLDAVFSPDGRYLYKVFGKQEPSGEVIYAGGQLWMNPLQYWGPNIYRIDGALRARYNVPEEVQY